MEMKEYFEKLKRDNYCEWQNKRGKFEIAESYEEWVEHNKFGQKYISDEIKYSNGKDNRSIFGGKRFVTFGGLKYVTNITKLAAEIGAVYNKDFIPEETDIVLSSNIYYMDFIHNGITEYWQNILSQYPNISVITENDFLRVLGYEVPKDKFEKREDMLRLIKGKNISFIGCMNYIDDCKDFTVQHQANYCNGIDPDKVNIIVMSDSYYKKYQKANYKPKTVLEFLSKLSASNPDIITIKESKLLSELGIKLETLSKKENVRPYKGESYYDKLIDYTVIDLETTSKYINSAEIIEMSAVKVRNGEIVDEFSKFIKPSKEVPEAITNITGITNEMLEGASSVEKVLPEYLNFIGDDIIVGHNIDAYDSNIIYDLCDALKLPPFHNDMIDTYQYAKYCDIDVPNHKLTTISQFFGIKYDAHRALNDCIANHKCYELLKEKYTGVYKPSSGESKEKEISCSVSSEYADLTDKTVVLTGDFKIGERSAVTKFLELHGAIVKNAVSGKTNYVIVGGYGSSDWAHGNYGTKVKKALELQQKGKDVKIIKEEDFFKCLTTV